MLLEELKEYGSPKSKLARMTERGECFPITRGLYETDRNVPAYLLAGSICGPSYISFEYALGHYGLIPEAVYTVTSATFEKKKKKKFLFTFEKSLRKYQFIQKWNKIQYTWRQNNPTNLAWKERKEIDFSKQRKRKLYLIV